MDGKHVVFGEVTHGQELIQKMEDSPVDKNSRPIDDIRIIDCLVFYLKNRWTSGSGSEEGKKEFRKGN